MPDIEIRDAVDADVAEVLRVLAESGIDGEHRFTVDEAREHLARIRRAPNFRLLVALADGQILGTYSLVIVDKLGKRGAPAGVVEDIAVSPSAQRKGVGRSMMAHAIEECR